MRPLRPTLKSIALLLLAHSSTPAERPVDTYLTTRSGAEYSPAVSADSSTLVFTADWQGIPQLFRLDLAGRIDGIPPRRRGALVAPPVPLFAHPASTHSPAFAPKGTRMAFVSLRADALGDVFLADSIESSQPVNIGTRGKIERNPRFSRDGKFLLFEEADLGGEEQTVAYDLARGDRTTDFDRATVDPLSQPPYPPTSDPPGDAVRLLYADDTNTDGELGPGDDPSAWHVARGYWRQLTLPIPDAGGIATVPATGDVVISGRWLESVDLGLIPRGSPLLAPTTDEAFQLAQARLRIEGSASPMAIALLRRAKLLAEKNTEPHRRAAHLLARALNNSGRFWQASTVAEPLLGEENSVLFPESTMRLRLQYLIARYQLGLQQERSSFGSAMPAQNVEGELSELAGTFTRAGLPEDAAEAHLTLAEFRLEGGDPLAALKESEPLISSLKEQISPDLHARGLLLRARGFAAMELGQETRGSLLDVFRVNPPTAVIKERAALQLVALARESAGQGESFILEVRSLLSQSTELPALRAWLHAEEGRALVESRLLEEAERAFTASIQLAVHAPEPALVAARELVPVQRTLGRTDVTLTLLSNLVKVLEELQPDGPVRASAEALRLETWLEKAREEFDLGDVALAASTYKSLIEEEPQSADAWRGWFACLSVRPEEIERLLPEYKAATRAPRATAFDWYRYALALSYSKPLAKETREAAQQAITLEGVVPQYHLLAGFLIEQQIDDAKRRGRIDLELLERASLTYAEGLALVEPQAIALRADFLLNSANVALALSQTFKANDLYKEREQTGIPLVPVQRKLLFHWNSGIAAFQASDPQRAREQFAVAVELLDSMGTVLSEEAIASARYELQGRRALAAMDLNRYEEAAELFAEALLLSPPNSLARVRMTRNQANMLYRQSLSARVEDRPALLRLASNTASAALADLDRKDLLPDRPRAGSGALIEFDMIVTSDAKGGGSKLAFDVEDERLLLQSLLAAIASAQGKPATTQQFLAAQLASLPTRSAANQTYVASIEAVTLQRLAASKHRSLRTNEALAELTKALALTRLDVAGQQVLNGGSAALLLTHLLELRMASAEELPLLPREASSWWMVNPSRLEQLSDWELLGEAAQALAALRDPLIPDPPTPAVIEPLDRARLLLLAALCAEVRLREQLGREWSGPNAVRFALLALEANTLASGALDLANQSARFQEASRIRLFAGAIPFRLAMLSGEERDLAESEARLIEEARLSGQDTLLWWIDAQSALHAPTAEARRVAREAALTALLAAPVVKLGVDDAMPTLLFDQLEGAMLREAKEQNDPRRAADIVDRWRVVRLRWLQEEATPPGGERPEQDWLRRLDAERVRARGLMGDLSRLPRTATVTINQRRRELDATLRRLRDLQSDGAGKAYSSAEVIRPTPLGFEAVDGLLELYPSFALRREVAGSVYQASFTAQAATFVAADDQDSTGTFVLGDANSAAQVQAASMSSLLRKFYTISLRGSRPDAAYPTEASSAELRLAHGLQLTLPLIATKAHPSHWLLGDTVDTLGSVLQRAGNLESLRVDVQFPEGLAPVDERVWTLALVAWIDGLGLKTLQIGDRRWIGLPFSPEERNDIAAEFIAAAKGELEQAATSGDHLKSQRSLETVVLLKEAAGLHQMEAPNGTVELLSIDYSNLAKIALRSRRPLEALEAAQRSLELRRAEDPETSALIEALLLLGNSATVARSWDVARNAYTETFDLLAVEGDQDAQLGVLLQLADMEERRGAYADAFALGEQVLAILPEDQPLRVAVELRQSRVLLRRLVRYDAAKQRANEAMRLAEIFAKPDLLLASHLAVARCQMALSEFDDARQTLAAAESLAEEPLDQAQVLLEQINIDWTQSDFYEAFRKEQVALDLMQSIDASSLSPEERGSYAAVLVGLHNAGGLTSWSLNDLKRAYRELNEALDIARSEDLPAQEASTANNLALLARKEEKYDEALRWLEKALAIDEEQRNEWGIAYVLRNTGITLTMSGRAAEAIVPLRQAVEIAERIKDRVNLAKSHLALGDALREAGELVEADASYRMALAESGAVFLPEVEWRALYGIALLQQQAGALPEALASLQKAVDLVDQLRAAIRIEEFQDGFLLDKQDLYDSLVALLFDTGNVGGAFESSERSRGRNFIDLLGNQRLDLGNIEDKRLVERERELRTRIESVERRAAAADPADASAIATELATVRAEYSDFLLILRSQDPELASFLSVQPVDLSELQKLLEPGTRILSLHVLQDRTLAWIIGEDRIKGFVIPVDRTDLATMVQETRLALQDFAPVEEKLSALSEILLRPILPALMGADRVCVVPHRELHTLPFAALITRPGRYLIDETALYYSPSASILRYTVARRQPGAPNNSVLGIGNPDRGSRATNLPFAEKEADRLAFDFDQSTVRTGTDATETWLVDNLKDYGIVHIASHGEYDANAPLFSALLLAPDAQNDGTLTAKEVFSLQTRADLVALSACQTGLGRLTAGDEVVGLNRAFIYAGTRQLLSTLWRVDDISTAVLFKHFYRRIDTTSRAEALRQAQLTVKARPEFSHPAAWASVVLSGDWR
jgi:CHAT domain-containing protein